MKTNDSNRLRWKETEPGRLDASAPYGGGYTITYEHPAALRWVLWMTTRGGCVAVLGRYSTVDAAKRAARRNFNR